MVPSITKPLQNKKMQLKGGIIMEKHEIKSAVCDLIGALRNFAENPENIENFESYLERHFETWASKYANTAQGFIYELKTFSEL